MALELALSLDAERDIESILEYIAADNPAAARKIMRHVDETLRLLLIHPFMGPTVRKPRRFGLRKMTIAPYVLFYKVEDNTLYVVRVLHASQDTEASLEASWPDDEI